MLVYSECPLTAGGSNPVFDEVVLSLSLMNHVTSIDETAGKCNMYMTCVPKKTISSIYIISQVS